MVDSSRGRWNVRPACTQKLIVWAVLLTVSLVLGIAGCQLNQPRLIPSPLSLGEQRQAVLEVVPLGTDRDEAIKKLEEAGIEGSFSVGNSIYYCDVWNRDATGEHWHLDVALLFDQSGKLYKTRRGEADTGVFLADPQAASGESENSGPPNLSPTKSSAQSKAKTSGSSARSGRRSPFPEADDFQ